MSSNPMRNLLPSLPLFLLYIFLSAASLLVATAGHWFDPLVEPTAAAGFFEQIQGRFNNLTSLLQDPASSTLTAALTTMAFWSVVGAALYMLLWLLYAVVHALLNEIKLSLVFVHPRSFKESEHWLAFASRIGLKLAAAVVIIGYVVLFINVIWPAVVIQFGYGLLNLAPLSFLTQVLGAVATLVIAFHLLFLLSRVVTWRKA